MFMQVSPPQPPDVSAPPPPVQCQGSKVQWMLVSILTLWSPCDQPCDQLSQQQPRPDISSNAGDIVGQAILVYSMMRQVGAAMLQRRADRLEAAMQMTQLISVATNNGHW